MSEIQDQVGEKSCPQCKCEDVYHDGSLWVCPICAHEWNPAGVDSTVDARSEKTEGDEFVVRDANGNNLADGDSVIVIKDLKIKGAASSIKAGTKVKSIRLVAASDDHNIACKVEGVGAIHLKSQFVRKA